MQVVCFLEFCDSFFLNSKTCEENNGMPTSQLIDQKYDNALWAGIRNWGYLCGPGTFSKNSVTIGLHWG